MSNDPKAHEIDRLERLGREAMNQVVSAMPADYYFAQAARLRNDDTRNRVVPASLAHACKRLLPHISA